jgi:hypothetical protein
MAVFIVGSRIVIVVMFFVVTHLIFEVHLQRDHAAPPAAHVYYAMLHKRDTDPFFFLPLLFAQRWRRGNLQFGLRGDAFVPGFLARMIVQPRWLAHIFYRLDLGPILRGWGAHPLSGWAIRPLEDWVRLARDTLGEQPLAEVFTPPFLARLARQAHKRPAALAALTLGDLLTWRFQAYLQDYSGPTFFAPAVRRQVERRAVAIIKAQLAEAARVLQSNAAFLGSPEGQLSANGRIGTMVAAFGRMLRAGPPETSVVPLAIIYDFMKPGRIRVFLTEAAPITAATAHAPAEVFAQVRASWLQALPFTCTQIGTSIIVEQLQTQKTCATTAQFTAEVLRIARELAAQGRQVDAVLLDARKCARRVRQFLHYAHRHGVVQRHGLDQWHVQAVDLCIAAGPGEVGYERTPFAYAWNEWQDMLAASA